jgi:hypothetical protein
MGLLVQTVLTEVEFLAVFTFVRKAAEAISTNWYLSLADRADRKGEEHLEGPTIEEGSEVGVKGEEGSSEERNQRERKQRERGRKRRAQ